MGKQKRSSTTKGARGKKAKLQSIAVPLYPFDEQDSEKAILTDVDLSVVNGCLAPRARHCVLVRGDVRYRFAATKSDMARFKRLVRRFLIDAGIVTATEAAAHTFFELIGLLVRQIEREEDRLNAPWADGLRDIWREALNH